MLTERQKALDTTSCKVGDQLMYCRKCDFQHEPNVAATRKCHCGEVLVVVQVDEELMGKTKPESKSRKEHRSEERAKHPYTPTPPEMF